MNFLRQRYHSWLVPYVEGTLDARRRRTLEARLARDPQLAAEAEAQRQVTHRLRDLVAPAGTGEAPEAESALWRRVQAQIEPPRRVPPKPLVWAGSVCAVTGLAWAALWGPLGHLAAPHPTPARQSLVAVTPPQDLAGQNGTDGHRRHHLRHKARRTSDLLVRRLAPTRPSSLRTDTPTTTDGRRLAVNEPAPPTAPDTAPSLPEGSHSAAGAQFRLTSHSHPLGREEEESAPKVDTAVSEAASSSASETGDRAVPATADGRPDGSRPRRRRHRHHRRESSPAAPVSTNTPTAQTPAAPPTASDTPPVSAAPRRPKPLPID